VLWKGGSSLSSTVASGLYVTYFKPSSVFNHVLKCLGWNDHAKTLVEHVIRCKVFKRQDLHTLLGYSFQDAREEHFKVLQVNVSNVRKKNVGIDVYTKFIATLMKNEYHCQGNMSLIKFLLGLNITCQNNLHVPYNLCF